MAQQKKKKKRYSKLETEILATLNGQISLKDIHLVEDPNNTWLAYTESKQDKLKKKDKRGRKIVCGTQGMSIIGPPSLPYCGINEKCGNDEFECVESDAPGWGTGDAYLCCRTGYEKCVAGSTRAGGKIKICIPYKCPKGMDLCHGHGKFNWVAECCKSGKCFTNPGGLPSCADSDGTEFDLVPNSEEWP